MADLRTPTPYTFTLSALASGCATDPQTLTDWVTWDVDGTNFPAATAATITFSAASFVYATFTFPDMTVTSLTPGERLTLVPGPPLCSFQFTCVLDEADDLFSLMAVERPMCRDPSYNPDLILGILCRRRPSHTPQQLPPLPP